MKRYRKYEDHVKKLIVATGNINLFPELEIPRTTALYWIQSEKITEETTHKRKENVVYEELIKLRNELALEKIRFEYLKKLYDLRNEKDNYKQINLITRYKAIIPLQDLCKIAKISPKVYYQISRVKNYPRFIRTSKGQLTIDEQKKIYQLATKDSLSHLCTKRLHLYAYRNNLVICGYHTWRKYISLFGLKVPRRKTRRRKSYNSPLSSKINEIWHLDITEFKSKSESKLYLQVILDNYSRKVITWRRRER